MDGTTDRIVVTSAVVVPVPVHQAFRTFIEDMAAWWPSANTFGKASYETVIVEPWQGGRWYERDTDGREQLWGRVLAWEPPQRVVLTWQITAQGTPEPDRAHASVVEIEFHAQGAESTRIAITHRDFDRHGEGGKIWREAMASAEGGWPHFLGLYRASLDQPR